MTDKLSYLLGPTPAAAKAYLPPPPSFPPTPQLPTEYVSTPYGVVLVRNPNVCGICHRPRHRDLPHHSFLPDEARPKEARRLGWPTPPTQEQLP